MKRFSRRGNAVLEAALFIPFLITLLYGMEQLGKVTYTYYTLKKILFTIARYAGSQQGTNFCSAADPNVTAAINLGLTGTSDGSGTPLIADLTSDMLRIDIERYDATTGTSAPCDCSSTGCDTASGGIAPDYLAVSIPDGYSFHIIVPFLTTQPVLLKPQIKLPYGGT